ncbi:exonuclease 3'-5' domain containing 1 [Chamberlinius hualienensis]
MQRNISEIPCGCGIKFEIQQGTVTGIVHQNDTELKTLTLNKVHLMVSEQLVSLPDGTDFSYDDVLQYELTCKSTPPKSSNSSDGEANTDVVAKSSSHKNYILIDSKDYENAFEEINKETFLGCGAEGLDLGMKSVMSLITVATPKTCYVFDMFTLHKDKTFISKLKLMFESNKLLKVFYNCRRIASALRHQFNINLCQVYDIQVADFMIERQKNKGKVPQYARSLLVLIVNYLQMKVASCKWLVEDEEFMWQPRPLKSSSLEAAVLRVKYLIQLQQATLSGMLDDFAKGVGMYLEGDCNRNSKKDDYLLPIGFAMFDWHANCNIVTDSSSSHSFKEKGPKYKNKSGQRNYVEVQPENSLVLNGQVNEKPIITRERKIQLLEKPSNAINLSNHIIKGKTIYERNRNDGRSTMPNLVDVRNCDNFDIPSLDEVSSLDFELSCTQSKMDPKSKMPSLVSIYDFDQFKNDYNEAKTSLIVSDVRVNRDTETKYPNRSMSSNSDAGFSNYSQKSGSPSVFGVGLGKGRGRRLKQVVDCIRTGQEI